MLANDCSFGFTTIDTLKTKVSAYFNHVYENCNFGGNRITKFEAKCDRVKTAADTLTSQ